MCKTGFSNQKVESRKYRRIGHSTHGRFYTKDRHFNIMVLTHQTIDEHNDIIAGDIITIQTKCPAIQNLTGHLCPDRIKM